MAIWIITVVVLLVLIKVQKSPQLIKPVSMRGLVGLGIAGLLFFAYFWTQQNKVYLPDKYFFNIEGRTLYFNALKGKPVIINIWATW